MQAQEVEPVQDGDPEDDGEEADQTEAIAEAKAALVKHGTSRRLHNGKGGKAGKSAAAGNVSSESTVIRTIEQAFDIDFHPTKKLVVAGLITGQLKLYDYNDLSAPFKALSSRPHPNACRAVRFNTGGDGVFSASSDCSLQLRDLATNKRVWKARAAHTEPLNALALTGVHGVATGDDGGAVKVWDVRQRSVALSFFEHSDLINAILFTEATDGPTLCCASGAAGT